MKRLKILVIDDNPNHQQSARQTLGTDHDLTVVGGHDEALKALYSDKYHAAEVSSILHQQGRPGTYDEARNTIDTSSKEWEEWCVAMRQAQKDSYWDVVLSDLLMPAGRNNQGDEGLQYAGQEMPVGWSLAIKAALGGAKYVAVATDKNHHHHPASAMLDGMGRDLFTVHEAKALFTNYVDMVGLEGTECECPSCGGSGKEDGYDTCYECHGKCVSYSASGKNWGKILNQLLGIKDEASDNVVNL